MKDQFDFCLQTRESLSSVRKDNLYFDAVTRLSYFTFIKAKLHLEFLHDHCYSFNKNGFDLSAARRKILYNRFERNLATKD